MPTLAEQIVAVDAALDQAGVGHAFGGALALAYHAEPRATIDIDVNIWAPVERAAEVLAALPADVTWTDQDLERIRTDGQVRLRWDRTPLDLFFPQHSLHDEAASATERVPFGSTEIPVLSATHLAVFKALFNREKDWVDIGELLTYGEVDAPRVRHWLVEVLGASDVRVDKWDARVRSVE